MSLRLIQQYHGDNVDNIRAEAVFVMTSLGGASTACRTKVLPFLST